MSIGQFMPMLGSTKKDIWPWTFPITITTGFDDMSMQDYGYSQGAWSSFGSISSEPVIPGIGYLEYITYGYQVSIKLEFEYAGGDYIANATKAFANMPRTRLRNITQSPEIIVTPTFSLSSNVIYGSGPPPPNVNIFSAVGDQVIWEVY